jgi:hypothetical protein
MAVMERVRVVVATMSGTRMTQGNGRWLGVSSRIGQKRTAAAIGHAFARFAASTRTNSGRYAGVQLRGTMSSL